MAKQFRIPFGQWGLAVFGRLEMVTHNVHISLVVAAIRSHTIYLSRALCGEIYGRCMSASHFGVRVTFLIDMRYLCDIMREDLQSLEHEFGISRVSIQSR